ncbi:MAG TPA: COX15/CtaA family protein [Bryobacteraceae bacterium]|jgi:heme A synthase|nr:COX15/CtaA family protein [Bryobacteraceae bacterium]
MNLAGTVSRKWFARFALAVLLYNLPVILWGAYVRVSFSGDGCGANWPTCNGQLVPQKLTTPAAIEFTHRAMTSVDTVAVLALLVWAFLAFPRKHAIRKYALWSLVFLFIEALLGAGLVLFRLVAKDQSAGRAWYLSGHLTNTMLLLAALTVTAWLAYTSRERLRLGAIPRGLWSALALTVFVSITGAITALGDTLFPAASLASGVQQDFSSASGILLRLRVIHPLLALSVALYLVWLANRERPARGAYAVIAAAIIQVGAGVLNLVLLAPLAMQLIHLLLADLLWMAVVVLSIERAAGTQPVVHAPVLGEATASAHRPA